MLTLFLSANY